MHHREDAASHCEVYRRPQDATFVYEMNVFKLSLYFSHFFQMQMLRRFRIVTHCEKNCSATLRPGKTLKAMTSNNTGHHTGQYQIYILPMYCADIYSFPSLGLHSMGVNTKFLLGSYKTVWVFQLTQNFYNF